MWIATLQNAVQRLPRNYSAVRCLQSIAISKPVPPPRGSIQTPSDFLTAIGRSCETKLKVEDWRELWNMRRKDMKQAGLSVKDRRYILWSLGKYHQGLEPSSFAYKVKPPKKIRGWGPAVQFGKRIRSRRYQ